MNRNHACWMILGLLLGLTSCTPKIDAPELSTGRADFSQMVALGGHVLAGYQDGALYREGQQASVPNLIAQQALLAAPGRAGLFRQPEIIGYEQSFGLNSKPWESLLQTRSQMGTRVDCENVSSIGPVKDTLSYAEALASGVLDPPFTDLSRMNNLAIPFAGLWDMDKADLADHPERGGAGLFYSIFPNNDRSPVEAALRRNPTFIVMWPGMQDIYAWAAAGGTSTLPDAAAFRTTLDSILTVLTADGAKGVLANIPDVGAMPFFSTIPARGLELDANLADSLNNIYSLVNADVGFQAGENGFIVADAATTQGYRQLNADEYLTLTVPLDSMRCFLYGVLFQLIGDEYSLIASELSALRTRVAELNGIIADLAAQYDFALVDAAAFYERLQSGFVFDAVDFNTDFVSGGYFSLDGYTPHPKGAGLLANEFIHAINAHYDAKIPTVRIDALRGVLFP